MAAWVEWVGRRLLKPYLESGGNRTDRVSGQLTACLRELNELLRTVPIGPERTMHAHTFAELLADGDDELESRISRDLDAASQRHFFGFY